MASIDGLVSGLDTTSIIRSLMQLERRPQVKLQSQRAGVEKLIAALRTINTRISAVGEAAKALTASNGWQLTKGVSSDPTRVGVTAAAGAPAGSFSFVVKSLATHASAVSSGTVPSLDTAVATGPVLLTKGESALGFSSLAAGGSLAAGTHTVTVTQASSAATKAGTTPLAASTTISAQNPGRNDTLQISINGTAETLRLVPGTYSPQQLADEVNRLTAVMGVHTFLGADGALQLQTTAEGSGAVLQVTGGSAQGVLYLPTDATARTGTDGKVRLGDDLASEVTVTSAQAGQSITLTDADGNSVVATLAGGLRTGSATLQKVDVADGATLSQVVEGINKSGAGVSATAVQVSPGAFRLQLTSTSAGAAGNLSLGTVSLTGLGSMQTLTQGTDAVLTVGTGPGAYDVTRPSNTITDMLKGVTLTLTKADPSTSVTVDISTDTDGLANQVSKLVDQVNSVLSEIATLTRYNPTTKLAGLFVGDSMMRKISSDLIGAVTGQVAGNTFSPGVAGVAVQRDGTVKFDKTAFLDAYAKDPTSVAALFGAGAEGAAGVASRVEGVVKRYTDRADGLLPGAIKSKESQIRGFTERISSWDNRLALREQTLRRQYTAMEKALGAAQQQGQWLAGQIASLPTWGTR